MKIIHLSDLHIGKVVNGFSMIEDQRYIMKEIFDMIDEEKPDAIIIAGDVYDKSQPSVEAVKLFDDILVELAKRDSEVFIISGNHDSPDRLAYASRLMDDSGIHISKVYDGVVEPITLKDEYGDINFYLLPFLRPVNVKHYFEDAEIDTYTDAMRVVIQGMNIDKSKRNVLITHQFVTGASRCDSEEISIGGSSNVDVEVFDDFDYVALGHIHGAQNIGSTRVRYSGTPLKYSFSEIKHTKSMTIVDLNEKGDLNIRTRELVPLHDFVEIEGFYNDIVDKEYYVDMDTNAYMHIILNDEEDIVNVIGRLRSIYPNIMRIDYNNERTRKSQDIEAVENIETKSPIELFDELYYKQNNTHISDEQRAYLDDVIADIWEVER